MPGGLAQSSYATGGEVQRFAGGTEVSGAALSQGLTGTESNLSNFAGPYVTNMLSQGQALANAPYQAYGGQLTAGTSPLQQQAFQGAAGLSMPTNMGGFTPQSFTGMSQLPQQTGLSQLSQQTKLQTPPPNLPFQRSGLLGAQGAPLEMDVIRAQGAPLEMDVIRAQGAPVKSYMTQEASPKQEMFDFQNTPAQSIAQQYMNPYIKSALDPQIAELQRQGQIQNLQNQAKATSMGAFGGSGSRLMQTETQRNVLDKIQQALGQGYSTAYDKAAQQFNAEQQLGQQAQNLTNRYGLDVLGQQAGLGQVQRGLESEAVAADKAQFEEERANPYKMVQFQQSLLQGLPLAAQNYTVAQPSLYQQLAGGTSGLATLLANLGYTLPGSTAAK